MSRGGHAIITGDIPADINNVETADDPGTNTTEIDVLGKEMDNVVLLKDNLKGTYL